MVGSKTNADLSNCNPILSSREVLAMEASLQIILSFYTLFFSGQNQADVEIDKN